MYAISLSIVGVKLHEWHSDLLQRYRDLDCRYFFILFFTVMGLYFFVFVNSSGHLFQLFIISYAILPVLSYVFMFMNLAFFLSGLRCEAASIIMFDIALGR